MAQLSRLEAESRCYCHVLIELGSKYWQVYSYLSERLVLAQEQKAIRTNPG